ncbi:MAG: hypothetical protein M9944_21230 [Rhizobiaceae bacterium]|nr:hypothetical protein [Rhizobiaceae bacterium]
MNPLVLGGLIVGGLILIDVLLRLASKRGGGRLENDKEAIDRFIQEFPEIDSSDIGRVVTTQDRRHAFIVNRSDGVGFVRALGDRFVVRLLGSKDLASVDDDGETGLKLRFHDVTLRPARLLFSSADDRDFVAASLRQSAGI